MSKDMMWNGNDYPVSSPEEQGIHSKVFLEFFADVEKEGVELHMLSCTLPAVTSTPNTNPLLSQAVCASYANCRSCSPFTNIPLSGSVVETVFSVVPPPVGF